METIITNFIIKDSPAAVCIIDKQLCLLSYSDVWLQEFKIGKESLVGKSYDEVIPNTPREFKKILQDCLKGRSSISHGQKFTSSEGVVQWLKWKLKPWKNQDGSLGGLVMVMEDITEFKRREELLLKVTSVARIGGWEVDLLANTVHWTEVTKEIHEVPQDFIPNLEKGINFYKEGEHREKITALVSDAISEGIPWDTELLIVTAKGRELWVQAKGEVEIVNNKCVRLYGTFQDIDDKKKAELKYQEILERLSIATKAAGIGIWEYNIIENSILWDNNMYKLYGLKKKDFGAVYEAWEASVHPADKQRCQEEVEMAIRGEKEFKTEFRVIWPNKEIRHIRAESVVHRDNKGNPEVMIGTNWDITEDKKAEGKLKNLLDVTSEQNKSLMNFAHIVSHNLRSHSSNLSMLTGFLTDEESETEQQRLIQMLNEASESLNETVQHLNEVVKVKTAANERMKPVCLYETIKGVEKNLAILLQEEGVNCQIDVPKNLSVMAIPAYLDSIFLNLFTNVIKYKSQERVPQIKITSELVNNKIKVSLSDNGLGIDLDRHGGKIFGMYKTFHKHKDARGIGLFITKNQIEAMNGKIELESEVNVGTTVQLYFDIVQENIT